MTNNDFFGEMVGPFKEITANLQLASGTEKYSSLSLRLFVHIH